MIGDREQHAKRRAVWGSAALGAAAGVIGIVLIYQLGGRMPENSPAGPELPVLDSPVLIGDEVSADSSSSALPRSVSPSEEPEPLAEQIEHGIGGLMPTAAEDSEIPVPVLSPEQIRQLHARQRVEIERMVDDPDGLIVSFGRESETPITVGYVRSLHAQQELAISSADDQEPSIPFGVVGGASSATVAQVRAAHEVQDESLVLADAGPGPVLNGFDAGGGSRTVAEIRALHEAQHAALDAAAASLSEYPALIGEGGGNPLTVDQVRQLHERQTLE